VIFRPPEIALVATGGILFATPTNPSIQFRNFTLPTITPPSTFDGPAVSDFTTWTGKGLQRQTDVTLGFYWRF
jgi:hypothetical protein